VSGPSPTSALALPGLTLLCRWQVPTPSSCGCSDTCTTTPHTRIWNLSQPRVRDDCATHGPLTLSMAAQAAPVPTAEAAPRSQERLRHRRRGIGLARVRVRLCRCLPARSGPPSRRAELAAAKGQQPAPAGAADGAADLASRRCRRRRLVAPPRGARGHTRPRERSSPRDPRSRSGALRCMRAQVN
jgi:hypothetical protein